jgi:hypothetical protein
MCGPYFSGLASRDPTSAPPFDRTIFISAGVRSTIVSGLSPSFESVPAAAAAVPAPSQSRRRLVTGAR